MSYQSNYPPGVNDLDIDIAAGAVCPSCGCEYREVPCPECDGERCDVCAGVGYVVVCGCDQQNY